MNMKNYLKKKFFSVESFTVKIPEKKITSMEDQRAKEITKKSISGKLKSATKSRNKIKEHQDKGYAKLVPESESEEAKGKVLPEAEVYMIFDLKQITIYEMFNQVKIKKADQVAQRCLWRNEEIGKIETYAMQVMISGVVCSPFSAQYVQNRSAMQFQKDYHRAVDRILNRHYTNDYLDSVDTKEEAIKLINEVITIRKAELRSKKKIFEKEAKPQNILGMICTLKEDTLTFSLKFYKVKPAILVGEKIITKRDVLRVIMSVFEPLGLLGHFTTREKLLSEARNSKTYVVHSVEIIQEHSGIKEWKWMPSKLIVADIATRGGRILDFSAKSEWFDGPSFLYASHDHWPQFLDYTQVTEQRLMDQKPQGNSEILAEASAHKVAESVAQEVESETHVLEAQQINRIKRERKVISQNDNFETELVARLVQWTGTDPNKRKPIPRLTYNKRNHEIVNRMNAIFLKYVSIESTIEDIHLLIYCAALTINDLTKTATPLNQLHKKKQKPKWQIRIEKRTQTLRADIGRASPRYIKTETVCVRSEVKEVSKVSPKKIPKTKQLNNNEKGFYRALNTEAQNPLEHTPTAKQIEDFWRSLWLQEKIHSSLVWIEKERNKFDNVVQQDATIEITSEMVAKLIIETHNWKSPGQDRIHNYWYKKFTSLHPQLARTIQDVMNNPANPQLFLTAGITYIKPKSEETTRPENYRPIACLSTLYKIITAVITVLVTEYIDTWNILAEEQKGCKKGSQGCKEQLIIDSVILKQAEKQKRNLHMCYIDYKKAFDSVTHSWLLHILEIYKISPSLINFLKRTMSTLRTKVILRTASGSIETTEIPIQCVIFQGDSLSPPWFWLSLNPIFNTLNATKYEFQLKLACRTMHVINYLFYVDDIKMYMNELCKAVHTEHDFLTRKEDVLIETEEKEAYMLRILELSRNLNKAINTYAIPVLTYFFGIIPWSDTELDALNRITRTLMTKYNEHYPKSAIERINIPRAHGGRELIDIKEACKKQTSNLKTYLHSRTDHPLHIAINAIDKSNTPLHLAIRSEISSGKTNCHFECKCGKSVADLFFQSHFTRGLHDSSIWQQLLIENDSDFKKILKKAQAIEASKLGNKEISANYGSSLSTNTPIDVNRVSNSQHREKMKKNFQHTRRNSRIDLKQLRINGKCIRCGHNNHNAKNCLENP
ncbi:hypothetical protein ILUMI_02806 [Ignelater luminosus]|uniref:Reverse transcriptase domain-containing protein n=1 Tax=Ignelater luminosus TaxID=2038154 RepID=A0A8K0DC47_IGNLU|nr:hypothetical protein ILUMI_02806 [Ignelater luminosus]